MTASDSMPPQPPSRKPGHGQKHRPKSHPALRRLTVTGQSLNPEVVAQISDQLDVIAGLVAKLPDYPDLLTFSQRERLRIIGHELLRRADE